MSGLTWESCLVYLDDVIVFSKTFNEHVYRLSEVFQRLSKADLKLKATKCHLFEQKVSFLGHVVSGEGIQPDSEKIRVIETWPRPKSVSDVRAFVGLAGYYRSFVAGFAGHARPLHELTGKQVRFKWEDSQECAFNELKTKLINAPVLCTPRNEGKFILDTDASDFALGAILQQEQDGEVKVIAYASRCLNKSESSYCTTRKELLAVIYGLKKFRQFLLAREFVIRTDHAALTSIMKTAEPLGQQARWLDLLAEFNFTISHRPGISHRNADALSRRPCERKNEHCKQCACQLPDPKCPSADRQNSSDTRC